MQGSFLSRPPPTLWAAKPTPEDEETRTMEIIQGAKIQGDDVWMVNGQYCTGDTRQVCPCH